MPRHVWPLQQQQREALPKKRRRRSNENTGMSVHVFFLNRWRLKPADDVAQLPRSFSESWAPGSREPRQEADGVSTVVPGRRTLVQGQGLHWEVAQVRPVAHPPTGPAEARLVGKNHVFIHGRGRWQACLFGCRCRAPPRLVSPVAESRCWVEFQEGASGFSRRQTEDTGVLAGCELLGAESQRREACLRCERRPFSWRPSRRRIARWEPHRYSQACSSGRGCWRRSTKRAGIRCRRRRRRRRRRHLLLRRHHHHRLRRHRRRCNSLWATRSLRATAFGPPRRPTQPPLSNWRPARATNRRAVWTRWCTLAGCGGSTRSRLRMTSVRRRPSCTRSERRSGWRLSGRPGRTGQPITETRTARWMMMMTMRMTLRTRMSDGQKGRSWDGEWQGSDSHDREWAQQGWTAICGTKYGCVFWNGEYITVHLLAHYLL